MDNPSTQKTEQPQQLSDTHEGSTDTPFRVYDKTPLEDVEKKLITPSSPADLIIETEPHEVIDTETVQVEPISPIATAVETGKKPKSRKGLLFGIGSAAVVGVAATVITATALFNVSASDKDNEPGTQPEATPTGSSQEVAVPPAAQDFINAYGTRYEDPVATYYAEAAYEQKSGGDSLTIGDEYINSYNFESTVAGGKSPLGFDLLSLSADTEVNTQTSKDQFNNAVPTINRLISLLSKNPTPQQQAVIADEFVKYSGYGGNPEYANNLVTFLEGIVSKYGTSANYTVNPGSTEITDPSQATIFNPDSTPTIDDGSNGEVRAFHNTVTLSISVESYDSANEKTSTTETVDGFVFMVQRAPKSLDPLGGGWVGIGTR